MNRVRRVEAKGECCSCEGCMMQRQNPNTNGGWCRRVIELCNEANLAAIKRKRCRDTNYFMLIEYTHEMYENRRKAVRLLTQMFEVP